MKCPKCGYNSFEHLDECKKCGNSLAEHKAKFNLKGFYSPGMAAPAAVVPSATEPTEDVDTEESSGDDSVDFGFDFLDEAEDQAAPQDSVQLGDETREVSIDQPFGADSEAIPADDLTAEDFAEENDDSDDKPDKGPEFAF